MALFHLSVTQTKRSAGQSAIASAAYRAGERYLNVAALPCSLIPTPLDDEQSPGIFHLQEDFE